MPFGDSSKTRIAYIAESTFGTTPATPVLKEVRRTGGALDFDKSTAVSGQVSSVRDIRGEYQVGHDVKGSIPFEFNNASFDDFLEAVTGGTWASNVLKTANTSRSFTFEETLPVAATSHYLRFLGCGIDTLDLNVQSRALVTGSVGIMGRQLQTPATAIIAGATYTAPNSEAVFSGDKVGTLSVLGGTPIIKNISLSFRNNLRMRPSVGSLYSSEFGMGAMEITGNMEAYFEDATLLNAVLSHTSGALTMTVGVDTNKKYTFAMAAAQVTTGNVRPGSQNDDVMASIAFRAVYDAGSSTSISITRLVA